MPESKKKPGKPPLDSLTSLRFFAALMILVSHATGVFHLDPHGIIRGLALGQGVSFFYVLSGFILTYNYYGLQGPAEVKRFLWARIGRIWPSHVAMCCLALIVRPHEQLNLSWTLVALIISNLLMIQAWIPVREYYYSINAVSWSISDEFFFYLCFVLLIRPWRSGWIGKLSFGVALVVISIFVGDALRGAPHVPIEVGNEYLPYVCPLARLLEFILGILTALAWMRQEKPVNLSKRKATIAEILSILLVVASVVLTPMIVRGLPGGLRESAFATWLLNSGGAPVYALLIFTMAFQQGRISQFLTHRFFVWLGEISYSIYLVHAIFLRYADDAAMQLDFAHMNRWLAFGIYFLLVLLASHLNFTLIESPFRKVFRRLSDDTDKSEQPGGSFWSRALRIIKEEIHSWSKRQRTLLFGECILAAALIIGSARYTEAPASRFQFVPVPSASGVQFADKILLQETQVGYAQDGIKLRLIMRSLARHNVEYNLGLDFLDSKGKKVASYIYWHEPLHRLVLPGNTWIDDRYFPSQVSNRATSIALAVWSDRPNYRLLPVGNEERRDRKLIIPINKPNSN